MPEIRHPEWRRYHETTKYPFADRMTLTNVLGVFIPDNLFIDAILYPVGGLDRMYLSRVVVTNEQATVYVGDVNNSIRANGIIDILEPPDNVELHDEYGRPAGVFVSEANRLATFQSWTLGTHDFLQSQTEFAARVCIPTPEVGVRGFLLDDGSIVAGDVWIVGDDGVVVTAEEAIEDVEGFTSEQRKVTAIRIDVVGDPLFRRRLCSAVFETPNLLKTITVRHRCNSFVCGPDASGDFKLTVGDQDVADPIMRIRSVPEGLIFEAVGEKLEGIQ